MITRTFLLILTVVAMVATGGAGTPTGHPTNAHIAVRAGPATKPAGAAGVVGAGYAPDQFAYVAPIACWRAPTDAPEVVFQGRDWGRYWGLSKGDEICAYPNWPVTQPNVAISVGGVHGMPWIDPASGGMDGKVDLSVSYGCCGLRNPALQPAIPEPQPVPTAHGSRR